MSTCENGVMLQQAKIQGYGNNIIYICITILEKNFVIWKMFRNFANRYLSHQASKKHRNWNPKRVREKVTCRCE